MRRLWFVAALAAIVGVGVRAEAALVAAYGFDEASGSVVGDGSGNANAGTVSGATWVAPGQSGSALSFDGVNDFVSVPDASLLDATTAVTVEAWIYPRATGDYNVFIAKTTTGLPVNYFLSVLNGQLNFGFYTSAWREHTTTNAAIATNTWYHVAAVFDDAANNVRIYRNGVQLYSATETSSMTPNGETLRIGIGFPDEAFNGNVDDVRVYNHALTTAEIAADMNTPVTPPPPPPLLAINQPAEGATIVGTTVQVLYGASGDLSQADHAHFRLDGGATVMDIDFDGARTLTNVLTGPHTLLGIIARADHSEITGSSDTVNFTTVPDPSDPVAPTVAITAPTAGATLSGQANLAANASDDIGVFGVQFLLDGANLGPEDVSAPYEFAWDTFTASNGSHTLRARARDVAGNQTLSASVPVSVSNSTGTQLGQWSGVVSWPIPPIHLTLQPGGDALLFDDSGGSLARRWNNVTGNFTSVPVSANLFCAGHAPMADGRTAAVGGQTGACCWNGINQTNLFDPNTNAWTRVANMAFARWYPTATKLPDGRILTVSGTRTPNVLADTPEVYNPTTNTWTQLTTARLPQPLYPFMFVLPDGLVFDAGPGIIFGQGTPVTRQLNVATQTWTVVGDSIITGGSAAMYEPGRIVKSGTIGDVDFQLPSVDGRTVVIDMNAPSPAWREVASMAFPRSYHNLVLLPDGTVLAVGGERTTSGQNVSQAVYQAEVWTPATETWRTLASMQRPRLYHSTALLLRDGRVLMTGGDTGGYSEPNAEIFSPPYLFQGARPTITSAPTSVSYGSSFMVQSPQAGSIQSVALMALGSVTHAFDQNQRRVPLAFTANAGTLTVTAPANANLAPPGFYMLFLVSNGVPSVAEFVRVVTGTAAGIFVTPTSGLVTTEAGGTATFTVVLNSAPTANVSIALSSSNPAEGTPSPTSVSFTTANWNVPQTVTVTGQNDAVVDGNVAYSIVTAAATSTDPAYNGLNAVDVSATNQDDDNVGITVSPTSGLATSEGGEAATFTVVLTAPPTASVTVGIASSDATEGVASPASLVFGTGNWSVPQTVTVTGQNDAIADGNVAYTIATAPATSADSRYAGLNPADVGATNADNDAAGIAVNPTSGLLTGESGGTATFTVALTSEPTATVTIGVASNDATEGVASPVSLVFGAGSWALPQTVTVTGQDDAIADGSIAYSIVTAPATSADPGYSGRNGADVAVTNADNDTAGIAVNPTSGLVTTEAAGTATFSVVLASEPTATVTIGVASSDATEGVAAPASLVFGSGSWSTPQIVTVTGQNDTVVDGDVAYAIATTAATSADPGYGGMNPADVAATNQDDDVLPPDPSPPMEYGVVSGVSNTDWTAVALARTYTSMVVVATPNYSNANPPLAVRIRNAAGSGFEVRVDRADTGTAAVTPVAVHYLVVEEGIYTTAVHGVTMEARTFTSTVTDRRASWVGQVRTYANIYASPVVIGQVMTYNDPRFSVFWSRGSQTASPPSATSLRVGKHVGEDSVTTRANETIGYVVFNAGSGVLPGLRYTAALGADTISGAGNAPPYTYATSGVPTPAAAVASQAGMDGSDGSWAVLYGPSPLTPGLLRLAVEEDNMGDAERNHTSEQVGYAVFGPP